MAIIAGFTFFLKGRAFNFILLFQFFLFNAVFAQTYGYRYSNIFESNVPEIRNDLKYFGEIDKKLSSQEALSFYRKGLFHSIKVDFFNLPYTMNNHWLGMEVKNPFLETASFYFEVANPHIYHMELWKDKNGTLFSLGITGDAYPFYNRPLENRNFVYRVVLAPQEESTLLLKVNTGGRPVTIPINFLNQQDFDEKKMDSYLLWGIVSGFFLLTATLSFILFLLLKDSLYLIYCFINILLLTWILGRNGLGYQYIWPDYPEVMARIMFISAELNMVVYLLFMQLFIAQNKRNSRFYVQTRWVMWILLFLVALVFLPYPTDNLKVLLIYQAITDLVNVVAIFLLFAGVIEKVKQKNDLAKFLFFSLVFSFTGVIMLLLVRTDFISANIITLNAFFVGFILEIIILAVGLAFRYRKQIEEKNSLQQELRLSEVDKALRIALATEQERSRIAADMHDDLGASLSGLQLMSEISARKENVSEMKKDIDKIHKSAKELSLKIKDIVWTLNPRNDTLENLALYIHRYGQQLFEDSEIRYKGLLSENFPHIIVEGSARRQLLLLVKEAYTNILKHAEASEVFCSLDFSKDFIIHIKDNGQGIILQATGGNGLRNMQNRIEELKGELKISKEKGTAITFILPVNELTTPK